MVRDIDVIDSAPTQPWSFLSDQLPTFILSPSLLMQLQVPDTAVMDTLRARERVSVISIDHSTVSQLLQPSTDVSSVLLTRPEAQRACKRAFLVPIKLRAVSRAATMQEDSWQSQYKEYLSSAICGN